MDDTALLITTFLRDELLFRCISSVRKYYPDIAIYVGDNGNHTAEKQEFIDSVNNCTYLKLPFDCGVGGTRNEAIKEIPAKYKYLVIVEDDILFINATKLESWRKILDRESDVGLVGGLLKTTLTTEQHYEATTRIESKTHHIEKIENPEWKRVAGIDYYLCDLILNVFMVRMSVFDTVKWDEQFKTAFEHSDFFLRLKYRADPITHEPVFKDDKPVLRKKPIKVAYTPDVWMYHKHDCQTPQYLQYRRRPKGYQLFGLKWKIQFLRSSYSPSNPTFLKAMGLPHDERDTVLDKAVRILERHGCKWWLACGSCLGAVRDLDFIPHDLDIDIGLPAEHLDLWSTFIDEFKATGFKLYMEWTHKSKKAELSFTRDGIKLDLFFFYKVGDKYWQGVFGPDDEDKWTKPLTFYPYVHDARLFDNPKEIFFRGQRCFVPNPAEEYLFAQYGASWRKPHPTYRYWKDSPSIDRHFFRRHKVVFVGGTWDAIYAGQPNILEEARQKGTEVIVGVLTDEAAGQPIAPFEDRKRLIESLKIVDTVITQTDIDPTGDLKKLKLKPHYFLKEDITRPTHLEPRPKKRVGKKTGLEIAIAIKTFCREGNFFRVIKAIKQNFPYPYRLYIADDGEMSFEKETLYQSLESKGHVIIKLPFNGGLSVGRNAILKQVKEDCVLVMDDDIQITDGKAITNMKTILDSDGSIGLVAGMLKNEGSKTWFGNDNYSRGIRFTFANGVLTREPTATPIEEVDDIRYRRADQVVNFFLARREIFDEIKWDNRIKIEYEHMDFFLELGKTNWDVVVCFDAVATHLRIDLTDPTWRDYQAYRNTRPFQYFYTKHNIKRIVNRY